MMFKRTALAAALLFGVSAQAQASPIVIDNFDLEQDVGFQPINPLIPSSSQVGPNGSVLGGFRDMQVTGSGGSFLQTRATADSGELSFSNSVGTTGSVTITWDGDDDPTTLDQTGLGGIDITGSGGPTLDRFTLDIVLADLPGLNIAISVFDLAGGSSFLDIALTNAVSAFESVDFLFSDFIGSADFTNVGAISLMIDGPAEVDAVFSNFQVSPGAPTAVPLPATLSLLLTGLGVFGVVSSRRRRQSAGTQRLYSSSGCR